MSTVEKGWVTFNGLKPDGAPGNKLKLPTKTVLHFRSHGHEKKSCEIFSIESVLANPTAIFEGLEREEFDGGICYCGIPTVKYINEETHAPTPPGMIFLIFTTREFEIFEFRWEKMSEIDFGLPQNHENRFKRKTWPRSSNS